MIFVSLEGIIPIDVAVNGNADVSLEIGDIVNVVEAIYFGIFDGKIFFLYQGSDLIFFFESSDSSMQSNPSFAQ